MSDPLIAKIKELKKKHNASILAHNYQIAEVQNIADFTGDSLELSIKASTIKEELIVFCGVYFMAETAKILNPGKTVIIPDKNAGCPMADMIKPKDVVQLKKENPKAKVVCYVNSSASVKAESDICCTSANAQKVVESIKDTNEILFIPDKYLGINTQKKIKGKKFILWSGYCPTHMRILVEDINKARLDHKNAIVMIHPECRPDACDAADEVLSTGGMIKFAKESKNTEFILGTEIGMLHRLRKDNPGKHFYPLTEKAICPNMKLTNLEKIFWALEELEHKVEVEKAIADKARASIQKMIAVGRND